MKISTEKCKVISGSTTNLIIENEETEIVKQFKYLWSLVPKSSEDVKRSIALASFKKSAWSGRDISVKLKLRLYNALILPIAIYGSETWSLMQLDTKKLSVFENNCLKAILKIRLQGHVSIDEIRKSAKQQSSIENIIGKRRQNWFGHTCHLNDESLQNRMMKEDFDKKRNRGRTKTS